MKLKLRYNAEKDLTYLENVETGEVVQNVQSISLKHYADDECTNLWIAEVTLYIEDIDIQLSSDES